MDEGATRRWPALGRLFTYANNPVTVLGIVVTTLAALTIITFLVVDLTGGLPNPYIAIFAYLILPSIFVLGLILIPVGMWRRARRLRREGVSREEIERFPDLDFNHPQVRRFATMVIVLTAVNAVILGASSYHAVHEMESVEFCGETCHTVMRPEFSAYFESPHSRVDCVECHIGPGASWFVRSKLDGLRQVWKTAFDTYETPIHTPLVTLRPARETCEQCHWPAKHHGDKLRIFARFAADESNSPSYTAMLIKTGGGTLDMGRAGGIHWWHIYSDVRIRYVATDDRREEIGWVELMLPDGSIRTYQREGEKAPPESVIAAEARVMDCIDCHNRPTHLFKVPDKALDDVLLAYEALRALPYYKRRALDAVTAEYPTHDAGMAAVERAVLDYYRTEHPQIWATTPELVQLGAAEAANVYGRSVFPEMETNWTTHPNHIGHDDFPGCWRCHDGEMVSADGQHVIPIDCDNCHVMVVEDSPVPPDLSGMSQL